MLLLIIRLFHLPGFTYIQPSLIRYRMIIIEYKPDKLVSDGNDNKFTFIRPIPVYFQVISQNWCICVCWKWNRCYVIWSRWDVIGRLCWLSSVRLAMLIYSNTLNNIISYMSCTQAYNVITYKVNTWQLLEV